MFLFLKLDYSNDIYVPWENVERLNDDVFQSSKNTIIQELSIQFAKKQPFFL